MADRDRFDAEGWRLASLVLGQPRPVGGCAATIAAVLREVDRAAREECAQIADGWDFGETIAAEIRATIGKK